VPPNIDAVGDQFYCPLDQINVVTSFDIVDPDDTQIESMSIQISTGYLSGQDQLILMGSHPNIVTSWDTTKGKLTLTGLGGAQMLYTDLIAAVNDVVFQSTSTSFIGEKYFSFTIGDANYLPSTGHYYEYVPSSGITWSNARTAAANRTYYGLQGYLATIGSPEEAQLSGEQAGGAGWLGGTDEAVEGVWRWVTGPEAGTTFWNGGINGSTPNYANWNANEPNNCCGGEDYVHVTFNVGPPGSWNDLPNIGGSGDYYPQGYIVEYGGMPGDPVIDISASTKITVPSIVDTFGAEICGPGTLTLEANPSNGTVVWFDAPTGGTPLGSGTIFNTPSINTTTTYYTLASVNGCLDGARTPVVAAIKEIPIITSVTDALICDGGSAVLMASANLGIINWYDTMVGGTALGTGGSFTTPSVTDTTTFYVDATSNGCTSTSRTAVTITVQKTVMPSANALQTFCDIDNATVGDLTASGTDIQWYGTETDGTPLDVSELLATKTYYATQTEMGCESPSRFPVDVIVYETVVPLQPSEIPIMEICDTNQDGSDTNGFAEFDLTSNASVLLNGHAVSDFQLNYFTDAAYTNQISNPNAFVNTVQNNQSIYVRMENNQDNSCYTDIAFTIQVNGLPVIQPSVVLKNCDEDGTPDGFTDFNPTEANDFIVNGNSADFEFSYYLSYAEADLKTNAINPVPFNNSTSSTVYARVENSNGCHRVSTVNLQVSTTSFSSGYQQELEFCDDDNTIDGLHEFDLTQASSQFIAQFPTGQNLSVHYYRTLTDAQLEQNEITSQTNYINETPFSQILYVRVESEDNGDCFGIGPHLKLTVHPRPEFEVDQTDIHCLDNHPITLYTYNPSGNFSFEWKDENGMVVSHLPTATVIVGGTYTVVATSSFGCESFLQSFTVVESAPANITMDDVTIVELSDNNSITIDTSNLGIGDYEFALDHISGPYQDAPYFDHVGAGMHTLYVQDKKGCGIAELKVYIMGFPKFFTPNDDGYNDTWNIEGLSYEYTQNSTVYIFDRYGKLLKQINPRGEGWNGLFNGEKLRSSDYWFVAELINVDGTMITYRGHFSLVR
ncbi:MAG TPA: T9SS type B sorting domain-containing protein, partial [Flavobacteriaceae bacterium]